MTYLMNECEIHTFLGGKSEIPVLVQRPLAFGQRDVFFKDRFYSCVVDVETAGNLFEHSGSDAGVWGSMGLVNHKCGIFTGNAFRGSQVQRDSHRRNIPHVVSDDIEREIAEVVVNANAFVYEASARLDKQMNRRDFVVNDIGEKLKNTIDHVLVYFASKRGQNF